MDAILAECQNRHGGLTKEKQEDRCQNPSVFEL
jgi:hypothetical protein